MPQVAQSITIPAPVGGWNTRDPLDLMAEQDAPRLVNIFPDGNDVILRGGFQSHATGLGSGVVETLAEHVLQDGTRSLVGCADNRIFDATSAGAATEIGSAAKGDTITSNRWQTLNCKTPTGSTVLLFFNGADQPLQWSGTGDVTAADYTGTDPNGETLEATDNNDVELIAATTYRNRLYVIQKDRTWFWYGGVQAVTGALEYFDVGSLLELGGYINNIGTWTIDAGNGINEHLVLISNMGEGLVYAGTYPEASSWFLVGRFYLPPPLGRRSLLNLGTNLVLLTTDGVMPLTQALFSPEEQGTYKSLSDKIKPSFSEAARSHGSNFGWQGLVYPRGRYALFNVPITEGVQSRQYVMNVQTGAWCEFRGMDAVCWALYNNKPYFGGTDGTVYEADQATGSTNNDNGSAIEWQVKSAFNYGGDRAHLKHFTMGRPVVRTSGDVEMTFDVDVDFSDKTITSLVSVTGSGTPWGSPWGSPWAAATKQNKLWYSVAGLGRCAAVRLGGSYKNILMRLSAIHLNYTPGGYL